MRVLLDLLIPAALRALCGGGGDPVCAACLAALPVLGGPECARCGKPTAAPVADCRECRGRRLGFDTAVAALAFEGRGRDLVRALQGRRPARALGAGGGAHRHHRPAARVRSGHAGCRPTAGARSSAGTTRRRCWRSRLARRWGLPARALLGRRRCGGPQRGLDHAARRRNVRGAFRPPAPRRRRAGRGRRRRLHHGRHALGLRHGAARRRRGARSRPSASPGWCGSRRRESRSAAAERVCFRALLRPKEPR